MGRPKNYKKNKEAVVQQQQAVDQQQQGSTTAPGQASSSVLMSQRSALKPLQSYAGTRGRPVEVEVNYFAMDVSKLIKEAYHYDVTFTPPGPKRFLPIALESLWKEFCEGVVYAFDGRKNVYTNLKLSADVLEKEIKIKDESSREMTFKVKVQATKTGHVVDLELLKSYKTVNQSENLSASLQCMEIVQKCRFKNTAAIQFGRQFYFQPRKCVNLGDNMELWRGLHQSIVLGTKCVYLNADVLSKAVPSNVHVMDVLPKNQGSYPKTLNNWQKEAVADHLKQLKVVYEINGTKRVKTFYKLGDKSARTQVFDIESEIETVVKGKKEMKKVKQSTTVEKYFMDKFKMKLNFPELPLIQVLPVEKKIFLPMELCTIAYGQLNSKKCSDICKRNMIKDTAVSTTDRKNNIKEFSRVFPINQDIKTFGVQFSDQFEKVTSRVLPAPTIIYNRGSEVVNEMNGSWNDGKYVEVTQESVKIAVLSCECNIHQPDISAQTMKQLVEGICKGARSKNLNLTDGFRYVSVDVGLNFDKLKKQLEDCRSGGFGLVIVIISDKRKDCYDNIKKIAETQVGVLTQCLKTRCFYDFRSKSVKLNFSTVNNILLKINTKLNGVNRNISNNYYNSLVKNKDIMFIGADVTHPTADQKNETPSVVAVCSSFDAIGYKYHVVWRLQPGGTEMIEEFEDVIVEQLNYYKKMNNNKLPRRIIYFRDGVAESQLEVFINPEIKSMKNAFAKVYAQGDAPKITLVIVNKRHHMRAFPLKESDKTKFNNILPGTVIDKDIVSPFHFQFFLTSHGALQGCSKPTKYTVFLNECGIQPDDMQELTQDLCHLYSRCNRSVSYPNCTYYAHLMAARAKCYTSGDKLNMEKLKDEFEKRTLKEEIVDRRPMFFT